MTRPWWRAQRIYRALAVNLIAFSGVGCSLDSLLHPDTEAIPPNATDPATSATAKGALAAYYGVIAAFRYPFALYVLNSGELSDELRDGDGLGSKFSVNQIDGRGIPESQGSSQGNELYGALQLVRGQASQAVGLLTDYASEQQRALVGHAYALAGYAEVLLAELYCSGIPLSTLDFNGDYTLKAGSTTDEVLTHAIMLFDSALTFAGDSARITHLAAVGKARALLGLGQYAAAAAAAAAVPDGFQYDVIYSSDSTRVENRFAINNQSRLWHNSVADLEGNNGLDYVTSGDPRATSVVLGTNPNGFLVYFPAKYAEDGSGPITLASGVEARLVAAEGLLASGSAAWLAMLNALRTDGTYDTTDTTPSDTLWHAGTGGTAGLKPLEDPGASLTGAAADSARVDLLFRERAFWLFLTGHRQGDLRRLIRKYGREEESVYPTGPYPGGGAFYGSDVTMPAPPAERQFNPLYNGCFSRDA